MLGGIGWGVMPPRKWRRRPPQSPPGLPGYMNMPNLKISHELPEFSRASRKGKSEVEGEAEAGQRPAEGDRVGASPSP